MPDGVIRSGVEGAIASGANIGLGLASLWDQQDRFAAGQRQQDINNQQAEAELFERKRNADRAYGIDSRRMDLAEKEYDDAATAMELQRQRDEEVGNVFRAVNMNMLRNLGRMRRVQLHGVQPPMMPGGPGGEQSAGPTPIDNGAPLETLGAGGRTPGMPGGMPAGAGMMGPSPIPSLGRGQRTPMGDDDLDFLAPNLVRLVQTSGLEAQRALYKYVQDEQGLSKLSVRIDGLKRLAGAMGYELADPEDNAILGAVMKMEDPDAMERGIEMVADRKRAADMVNRQVAAQAREEKQLRAGAEAYRRLRDGTSTDREYDFALARDAGLVNQEEISISGRDAKDEYEQASKQLATMQKMIEPYKDPMGRIDKAPKEILDRLRAAERRVLDAMPDSSAPAGGPASRMKSDAASPAGGQRFDAGKMKNATVRAIAELKAAGKTNPTPEEVAELARLRY